MKTKHICTRKLRLLRGVQAKYYFTVGNGFTMGKMTSQSSDIITVQSKNGKNMMVFKHALSYIQPLEKIRY